MAAPGSVMRHLRLPPFFLILSRAFLAAALPFLVYGYFRFPTFGIAVSYAPAATHCRYSRNDVSWSKCGSTSLAMQNMA